MRACGASAAHGSRKTATSADVSPCSATRSARLRIAGARSGFVSSRRSAACVSVNRGLQQMLQGLAGSMHRASLGLEKIAHQDRAIGREPLSG